MMKCEFERLAKYEVSDEIYKAIEILYMNGDLNKVDFVKKYGLTFRDFRIKDEEKNKIYAIKVGITPNGCYYIVRYARLIRIDVGRKMNVIKYISEEERIEKKLDIYSYTYDFEDYNCIEGI